MIRIVDLTADNAVGIRQAAELLVLGFREHWPDAWPDMESALEEVHEMLAPDRILRIAVNNEDRVLGWIGGLEYGYDDNVWELHPLVVHPDQQAKGIGRALIQDLEEIMRQRGVLTLQLGTDDVDNSTSLGAVDLYDNLWGKIQNIQNLKHHPYTFYQKMGYTIIGVMPDANGPGKPDIYMSKRL